MSKANKAVTVRASNDSVSHGESPESPLLSKIIERSSKNWSELGCRETHILFRRMSENVPAYRNFLNKNKIKLEDISSFEDLENVPAINKKNYISISDFRDMFWDGSLKKNSILTSTSGSSGQPVYFARSNKIDDQCSFIYEIFYHNSNLSTSKSTLVIGCFGMGVWIGGLITYQAFQNLGRQGYPISVITPGINQPEILRILKDIAPEYDQVILAGYPPFLKDIVDAAHEKRLLPFKGDIALLFGAEIFSEKFREYVAEKAGVKNIYTNIMNIYDGV